MAIQYLRYGHLMVQKTSMIYKEVNIILYYEKFCKSLKEHTMEIINFEKNDTNNTEKEGIL